jgi:1-phosphofructokinase family hexose kinase
MTGDRDGDRPGRLLFVAANPSIDRLYELDRLTRGDIHRPLFVVAVPGGKGLNAARAAVALGGSVTVAGIVAGRAGDWIVDGLAALGVEAKVARTVGETRTCVSVLDRSTGQMTEVYERGEEIEPGAWTALEAIVRGELDRGDVAAVTLSGSLPPGAPQDGFGRIARIAAASTRPVPVLADTYGPALIAVLAARPAIVKVNAVEAGEASGVGVTDAMSAAEAAVILRRAGAGGVIVTLGVAGAVVVTAGERVHLDPPGSRGAYPVGSGDAFLGAFAVAFARADTLIEAARFGLAAGMANAELPGAGRLDPTTVEPLREQVGLIAL